MWREGNSVRHLGIKKRTADQGKKKPFWKRRIKSKIGLLRREISKLETGKSYQSGGGKA